MTRGAPFLYSECSNTQIEKGTCHVNNYICFSKSIPDPSRACHRTDDPPGCRRNFWFHLDAYRPCHRTSRFKVDGWALEAVHLPVSRCLGRDV